MYAALEFIFSGLSSMTMGEQHAQESCMLRRSSMPRELHAQEEQHAQGAACSG